MSLPPEIQGVLDNRQAQREFISALAAFQADIKDPEKSATNPHFKSKFTDLHTLLSHVRRPLAEHGFAITQTLGYRDGADLLTTTLWHKGGHSVSGEMRLALAQQTPQGMGSAVTYAKRYSLSAILGLASRDEDDDGEEASKPPQRAATPAPRPAAAPKEEKPYQFVADAIGDVEAAKSLQALNKITIRASVSEWCKGAEKEEFVRARDARRAELSPTPAGAS